MAPDELAQALALGRAAWPGVTLEAVELRRYLLARPQADAAFSADLYLACACAAGDEQALKAFERAFGTELQRAGARLADTALLDASELRQRLHERLFVPRGSGKILEYSGRAPLSAWLRVVVARLVLNVTQTAEARMGRGEAAEPLDDALHDDPELLLLKRRYGSELKAAVSEALAALPARDRNLLRYAVMDGLTTEQLAKMNGVHRATAVRWLAAARSALRGAVRRALATKLGVSDSEVHSLVRLVRSELDLSLKRLLP
jgi:RNA polymerase sigma-70 factor (ECF subfamily)